MKKILDELRAYWHYLDKRVLACSAGFTALLVFINYHFGLNDFIGRHEGLPEYLLWMAVFTTAFGGGYVLEALFQPRRIKRHGLLAATVLLAALLFSWKMAAPLPFQLPGAGGWQHYWRQVLYWPYKFLVMTSALFIIYRFSNERDHFYGFTTRDFSPRPYLLMLLIMVPLILAASSQADFLRVYPKMYHLSVLRDAGVNPVYKLLYELAYGSDFFTIELFFRGFLIVGFLKFAGRSAILPMAMFYCTIHFGKPLGECISSFFGGLILGTVTYKTRTILGGLMVHLGIAWLMELFAWLDLFGK